MLFHFRNNLSYYASMKGVIVKKEEQQKEMYLI